MNPQPEQDAASLPETTTLATLAAQARFAALPSEQAVAAALELWRAARDVLMLEHVENTPEVATTRWVNGLSCNAPQPKRWPATLKDFYKIIVRAKDEAECQPRFKKFLRHSVEKEQAEIRKKMEFVPESERTDEHTPSPWNTLKFQLLNTEEALDKEVERRFAKRKHHSFTEQPFPMFSEWNRLAGEYLHWWEAEKTEAKRRAGRARALTHKKISLASAKGKVQKNKPIP